MRPNDKRRALRNRARHRHVVRRQRFMRAMRAFGRALWEHVHEPFPLYTIIRRPSAALRAAVLAQAQRIADDGPGTGL